jgi:hypothetical protein
MCPAKAAGTADRAPSRRERRLLAQLQKGNAIGINRQSGQLTSGECSGLPGCGRDMQKGFLVSAVGWNRDQTKHDDVGTTHGWNLANVSSLSVWFQFLLRLAPDCRQSGCATAWLDTQQHGSRAEEAVATHTTRGSEQANKRCDGSQPMECCFHTHSSACSSPICSTLKPRHSEPRRPSHLLRFFPSGQRTQAEAVGVVLAGDHVFVVRPSAPTVVAAHALLAEVEVQRDGVAVR